MSQRSSASVMRMLSASILLALSGAVGAQQNYPNKPIRLITPYAPGGATSILGRLTGDKLTQAWGQQVLLDNRPGGNTAIGSEAMVKAAPDGYTLLLITSTHVINSVLLPNLPYDAVKDFAPVATLAGYEPVLLVNPSLAVNSVKELIALAKSRPGQLNYATAGGNGSATHLTGEYFNMLAGVKINQVPYKGTGPVVAALMAGEVQMHITPPAVFISAIKAGKIKALAVGGETRLPSLPQVPTFTEAGMPAYQLKGWYGILSPAATPKPIVERLSQALQAITKDPEFAASLAKMETQVFDSRFATPAQLRERVVSQVELWSPIISKAGIEPQ